MAGIRDSIKIGQIELRNRTAVAPAHTSLASPKDGYVTDRLMDRYEYLARGGWGLICVEVSYIRFDGNLFRNKLSVATDFHVSGLSELASVIKMGGAKASLQIMHGGRQAALQGLRWGYEAIAPSAIPFFGVTPREMTTKECEELLDLFALCAARAKEAGFDAVSIHGANGFLPQQFMSPAFNKRRDMFGERMLWPTELVRRIKLATGKKFPLIWRFSADEFIGDKGITLEMSQREIVPALEEAGIDCLDVTGGSLDAPHMIIPTNYQSRGCLMYLARGVKEVAHVPVIGVGNINDPIMARKVIEDNDCDIVSFARAALADPHFAIKMLAGKDDEINKCIACYKCVDRGYAQKSVKCTVNPSFGNERIYQITPAPKKKRVIVVGGGPGGMEAARVAKLRGHDVILYEKGKALGGQLLLAVIPPGKEQIGHLIKYLSTQIKKLEVKINLEVEANKTLIEEINPDAVILATGAIPLIPEFCCIDSAGINTFQNVVTAFDVLSKKITVGEKVVVVGGDLVACETADFLAQAGKKVTIVRRGSEIGTSYGMVLKPLVLKRISDKSIEMIPEIIYDRITDRGLVVIKDEKEKLIEADTIVIAAGLKPERGLYNALKEKYPDLYMVGDCVEPGDILDAIHQAYFIARGI